MTKETQALTVLRRLQARIVDMGPLTEEQWLVVNDLVAALDALSRDLETARQERDAALAERLTRERDEALEFIEGRRS